MNFIICSAILHFALFCKFLWNIDLVVSLLYFMKCFDFGEILYNLLKSLVLDILGRFSGTPIFMPIHSISSILLLFCINFGGFLKFMLLDSFCKILWNIRFSLHFAGCFGNIDFWHSLQVYWKHSISYSFCSLISHLWCWTYFLGYFCYNGLLAV